MTKNYKTSGGKLDTIKYAGKNFICIEDLIYFISELKPGNDSLIKGLRDVINE